MAMHVYAIIVAMIPLIDAIQNSSYHDCDVWQAAWFVDDAFAAAGISLSGHGLRKWWSGLVK